MSFIYEDDNLISDLVDIGVDLSNKLLKRAQVIDPKAMQALFDRLGDELTGAPAEREQPKGDITAGTDAGLFLNHIKSLRDLILFLDQSQFKYRGLPIIFVNQTALAPGRPSTTPEFDRLLSRQQKAQYAPYPPVEGGIKGDRSSFQFFVHKEGLLNYLKDLFNKSQDINNELFSKQISKLMNDASKELGLVFATPAAQSEEAPSAEQDQKHKSVEEAKYKFVSDKETTDAKSNEYLKTTLQKVNFEFPFEIGEKTFDLTQIEKFFLAIKKLIEPGKPEEKNYIEALLNHKTQLFYGYFSNMSRFVSEYIGLIRKQSASGALAGGFAWDPYAAPAAQVSTFRQMFSAAPGIQQLSTQDLAAIANAASAICATCTPALNVLKYSPQLVEQLGGEGQIEAQAKYAEVMASSLHQLANLLQSIAARPLQ